MSTLEISKQFQCSKEQLFSAWTEPEQLKQWWKPLGKQLAGVENDMAEGGTVKYLFSDDNLTIDGTYDKVVNHDLLEYTWNWHFRLEPVNDAGYKLKVRFEGDDSSSAISIVQDGFENAESIQPHQQGWEQGLEQLKSYVENQKSGGENGSAEKLQIPIEGYREAPEQVKVGGA